MTPEQFAELLKIATSVGGVVWEAALRQVRVEMISALFWGIFAGITLTNLMRFVLQLFREHLVPICEIDRLPKSNSRIVKLARLVRRDYDEAFALFLSFVFIVLSSLGFGLCLSTFISCLVNPEWAAIRLILSLGN